MNTTKYIRIVTLLAGISTISISTPIEADWSIMGLGSVYPTALNDSGQVVGSTSHCDSDDGCGYPFVTGSNGVGMTILGPQGDSSGNAAGINNSGQVVGYYNEEERSHHFITGSNGVGMTILDSLDERATSITGINDSGQVVGYYNDYDGVHTFITGPNGAGMTDLGIVDRTGNAIVTAINGSGQATGILNSNAFITTANGAGVSVFNFPSSYGRDINNSGQVVGWHIPEGAFSSQAFITGPNGASITNLGTLGGYNSVAVSINDSGEVIGLASTSDSVGLNHSFLFSHDGITDLSLLSIVITAGWSHLNVIDINNNGQIVGYGSNNDGHQEAFLLSYTPDTVFDPQPIFIPSPISPIPEPATYAMLFTGLGLIGFMAWRRRRAAV
ncbi:MAG: PEP-CTERM sorting domain-containing protein [Nitrosomonas ureae]